MEQVQIKLDLPETINFEDFSREIYLDKNKIKCIRVPRDYSHGILPRFHLTFPSYFNDILSEKEYQEIIEFINEKLECAEKAGIFSFFEGLGGCLSFYSLFLCYKSRYSKRIEDIDKFLREKNKVYASQGIFFRNPVSNGLLYIDILHFKPKATIVHLS